MSNSNNTIPTQLENPKGFHQRYRIQKVVKVPQTFMGEEAEEALQLRECDPGSEYFVLRLDEGGKDREHIKACRIAIHAYANSIETHLPELAKDLLERYPLLQ